METNEDYEYLVQDGTVYYRKRGTVNWSAGLVSDAALGANRRVFQYFSERIAELEAALPAWQPIETAPKDGTEIIVFHPVAGVCAAFCPKEGFAWHCMDGSNTIIGSKSGASIPRMTSFIEPPTHWLPLPQPPKEG